MTEERPALNQNTNFHKLWAGQSISLVGINVTYVALPLLAIYAIDAGAFEVGLITLAETVPYLLVTLWAGAWIDGRRRIPVMLFADLSRGAILVAVAVLTLLGMVNLEIIVGLMLFYGVGSVLFEVAYYAVVPSIVRRSDLMRANSRLQTSGSFALLAGTNIGGVLTQVVTAPFALIVDAFTFVASAVSLRWMRVQETIQPATPGESRRRQIWEGLRYVARQPVLRSLTLSSALYNFFTTGVMTLFPVFAVRTLELNAATIGFVQSFGAIGAALGALLATRMIAALGAGSSYIWAKGLAWASVLSLGLIPAHSPVTVAALVVAFSVSGMLIVSNVVGITLRQAVTNDQMLGRMTATYKFISYGAQSLGGFGAGLAGELFGLRAAMVGGGILLITTVLVALVPAVRTVRELPTEVPDEPTPTPAAAATK
ncbi:MFS transporter [Phytohabitans aurantiacus]|uniref:MFS transporter n=1 Tax=Phytohabitans aurantiacus TaxID=3016789 RepID=A0ABQ5R8A6_9ACTN|nr:MFS transporter [Phytohabitans aurantiacus]GLI01806.1 MFS transporter [Phytohabitans aurantiacus]